MNRAILLILIMRLTIICYSQKDLVGEIENIGLTNNHLNGNVLKIDSDWFIVEFDSLGNKILEINTKAKYQNAYRFNLSGQILEIQHIDSEYSASNYRVNYLYSDTSEVYIVTNNSGEKTDSVICIKNTFGQVMRQEKYHGTQRHILYFDYDTLNRITQIEWFGTKNRLLNKWTITYDDLNESILWVKKNRNGVLNQSHRIKLDPFGNRIHDIDENGKIIEWEYEYDSSNNWIKRIQKINGEIISISERKIVYMN